MRDAATAVGGGSGAPTCVTRCTGVDGSSGEYGCTVPHGSELRLPPSPFPLHFHFHLQLPPFLRQYQMAKARSRMMTPPSAPPTIAPTVVKCAEACMAVMMLNHPVVATSWKAQCGMVVSAGVGSGQLV